MKPILVAAFALCSFVSILEAQEQNGAGNQLAANKLLQPACAPYAPLCDDDLLPGTGCPENRSPVIGVSPTRLPCPVSSGQNTGQTIGAYSGPGAGAGAGQGGGQGQANVAGGNQCITINNHPKTNIQTNKRTCE